MREGGEEEEERHEDTGYVVAIMHRMCAVGRRGRYIRLWQRLTVVVADDQDRVDRIREKLAKNIGRYYVTQCGKDTIC